MAGILAVFRVAGAGPLSWVVAFASALILGLRPKLSPLFVLAAGAVIFVIVNLDVTP
jgi:hypothetical protein